MNQENIVYPMFAMVALPGVIMVLLFYFRSKAILEGKVDPHYLEKHGAESAPPIVVRLTHNLSNLFEFPILFLVICVLLAILQKVDEQYILLAWGYVGVRYIHSTIHITYNKVLHRLSVHFVSDMVLIAIWFRLLLQVAGVV